ncbi:MAG: 3-hydroxyacyl-CoA dehydrogenase family protein [Deltaproteobacteria bacterium]|nr:3-hydroxyacyl-CoA dehydrogenase family protein [Deltaproteobacteria bacterium]
MEIKIIGVLGAGLMGRGIAQVAAQAGYTVIMRDIEDRFVEGGLSAIDSFLKVSVEKGKMTEEEKKAIMGRIKGTTKLEDLKDVDFVIEAVSENMNLKKEVFRSLDELTRKEVILATNTSSLSITDIATATKRPDKVVGMHFFNPVPLMKLVEIIRGYYTSDETVAITTELSKRFGKETVEVKKDIPGFLVNRLLIPHFLEAISLYEKGIGTKEDIDKAAKLGLNYPMGPFELMDLLGNDTTYAIIEYFYNNLDKELKWSIPYTFRALVQAGRYGRKTKAGWYDYK